MPKKKLIEKMKFSDSDKKLSSWRRKLDFRNRHLRPLETQLESRKRRKMLKKMRDLDNSDWLKKQLIEEIVNWMKKMKPKD